MIKLTLGENVIELHTYDVYGAELYSAKDLLTGYGLKGKKLSSKLSNWVISMKKKLPEFQVVSKEGKNGGTYLTKREILKLSGYVSWQFEDAVYEAFEALVDGDTKRALVIARSVAEIKLAASNRDKLINKGSYTHDDLLEAQSNKNLYTSAASECGIGLGGCVGEKRKHEALIDIIRNQIQTQIF